MTKYVFVTGGVMSGIGKGIITASIAKILQLRGFNTSAMKIDPYLNFDAGTMNPIIHGEVFVTEDGGEVDMDLGTYERFLDMNLSRDHNLTTGQVYLSVIEKERRGDFLGKCVQIIPHVTDEIKDRIRGLASKGGYDLVIVEIGGTVGDIESLPYLEAARQLRLEESAENVVFVHVTLVPVLDVVGEQKTKPTQHSVQELRRIGIQPDIIVARSQEKLLEAPLRKIALFCNVEERAVFSSADIELIYQSPLSLDQQGMGDYLIGKLGLEARDCNWQPWKQTINQLLKPEFNVKIAICGKYAELADSYVSVNEALKHAGAGNNCRVNLSWIETETFEEDSNSVKSLDEYDGVLIPGGFGARGTEGKIEAIKFARTNDTPFLGICFGFQLAVVEFARAKGFENANSTEIDTASPHPVIDLMPEQSAVDRRGGSMRLGAHEINVLPQTMAHRLYNSTIVMERHRHRYEANPRYIPRLEKQGLRFSGTSDSHRRMEILELPDRLFHFATQFHAEFKSRPGRPSPPYLGFVKACLARSVKNSASSAK